MDVFLKKFVENNSRENSLPNNIIVKGMEEETVAKEEGYNNGISFAESIL